MVAYRRNRVPGGTFFFTVALRDRSSRLLVDAIAELRNAHALVHERHPFVIVATVVMPEHLHAIWRLPEGDDDYPGRWHALKARFVRNLCRGGHAIALNAKGEANVWQRRFWEHTIRDEADLRAHLDYLHWNPMKHGHVARVRDWPYSSFHRYVRDGVLQNDWGGEMVAPQGNFGE